MSAGAGAPETRCPTAAGLTAIQLACIGGLIYYSAIIPRRILGAPERVRP